MGISVKNRSRRSTLWIADASCARDGACDGRGGDALVSAAYASYSGTGKSSNAVSIFLKYIKLYMNLFINIIQFNSIKFNSVTDGHCYL